MHPRVGVGALLVSPSGRVLVGVRRGAAGAGTWALPGGHPELGEALGHTAARETEEETGVVVSADRWRPVAVENCVVTGDGRVSSGGAWRDGPPASAGDAVVSHYVTVFMRADVSGEEAAKNLEPHKCDGWAWAAWRDLSDGRPLFGPLAALVARCGDVRELEGM